MHSPRAAAFRYNQLRLAIDCLLFLCNVTFAAEYRFDRWTTENGLPSNWTLGIRQTPDGYLWLIAHGGLVRFDGFEFRVFNRTNTPVLKSTNGIVNLRR